MTGARSRAVWAALILAPLAGLAAGCLVESVCQFDTDCLPGERCNRKTSRCYVECTDNKDCWSQGKECVNNRCEFRYVERVNAPNFCMPAINPKSAYYNKSLCLSDLDGKVVMLYVGLMA